MVVDERLVTYINSLDRGNTEILDTIEREALDSYVPIIRKEMQSFLKLLLAMQKPKRILEVGTAVGFSAILMAEYNPYPCEIVTIENYDTRIPIARENFVRAGKDKQITLIEGDATEVLKSFVISQAERVEENQYAPSAFFQRTAGWCKAEKRTAPNTFRSGFAEKSSR